MGVYKRASIDNIPMNIYVGCISLCKFTHEWLLHAK